MRDQDKIGVMSEAESIDFAKKYVKSIKDKVDFAPPERRVFDIDRGPKDNTPITKDEKKKAMKLFKSKNKRFPEQSELDAFIIKLREGK